MGTSSDLSASHKVSKVTGTRALSLDCDSTLSSKEIDCALEARGEAVLHEEIIQSAINELKCADLKEHLKIK